MVNFDRRPAWPDDDREILVEGRKLSEYWGADFDRQFVRPTLNPQG